VNFMSRIGYGGVVFDGRSHSPPLAAAIAEASHLLVSIPPGATGEEIADPVVAWHAPDVAAAPHLTAVVYLSTIGVYGDAGGAWVDETTPASPTSARSKARLAAEQAWTRLAAERGCRLAILRLAGIYGPGRSAIDDVRAGTARRIIKPGQVFNRIHVDDVALACQMALEADHASGVYNVSDDEPAPPQDVVSYAAKLLGVPPPPEQPYETAALSPMARTFYRDNRRVRNERIKRELGVRLAYPTYREGLRALLPIDGR
jgi:nucleoside-diphosphate-sugar epimerase